MEAVIVELTPTMNARRRMAGRDTKILAAIPEALIMWQHERERRFQMPFAGVAPRPLNPAINRKHFAPVAETVEAPDY